MNCLYELTLKNRELIEEKVAELCAQDIYVKRSCGSMDDCKSIQNLLSNLYFELLSMGLGCDETNDDHFSEQIVHNANIQEIQSLMAKGINCKAFISTIICLKHVVRELVFIEVKDNADLHEYILQYDKSFERLQLLIYDQWHIIEGSDVVLKKIFELTPFGVFVYEGERFTHVNTVGEQLTGYSNAELSSMYINDLMHPDFGHIMTENARSWNSNKEVSVKRFESKIFNKSGAEVWVDITVGQVELGGKKCILGTAIDITDQKKIEEFKKQANESIKLLNETLEYDKVKTEFFSNLSHELRTPLNVILGTLQVMDIFYSQTTDDGNEKLKKYSKIMRQNCYRLLRLVNNLIDLNKLDAGYMNLNVDNHDIVSIVSKIATSVADYIENKGIAFSFETRTASKIIACDPDKMERIILNLLSNAVKFTDSGGKIMVRLWDNEDRLYIAVKDTGIGIPKEKQDLVFRRFVQIDKSLSRVHQGSGIGLSLVKSLVELQGGDITLKSDAGTGCEFTIELPIKQAILRETSAQPTKYAANNKIEIINIEFSDIYSQ